MLLFLKKCSFLMKRDKFYSLVSCFFQGSLMRLELNCENLLDKIDSLEYQWVSYIPVDEKLHKNTLFLIIDDEIEEERDVDDEPTYPASKGYEYFLMVSDLQDIYHNLQSQQPVHKLHDFIMAVNYYYDHDAYIDINS